MHTCQCVKAKLHGTKLIREELCTSCLCNTSKILLSFFKAVETDFFTSPVLLEIIWQILLTILNNKRVLIFQGEGKDFQSEWSTIPQYLHIDTREKRTHPELLHPSTSICKSSLKASPPMMTMVSMDSLLQFFWKYRQKYHGDPMFMYLH